MVEFHKGISATDEYLVRFFKNLLLGENNQLSNREMHISNVQSLTPKSQNDTLDCTLEEMAVLKFLQSGSQTGRHCQAYRQILKYRPSLIERGLLQRENGKRNGKWVVKI